MKALVRGVGAKPFLYLAAPLFSSAEKRFNEELSAFLGRYFTVYLPQRDGGLFVELVKKGYSNEEAARHVFSIDIKAIRKADVLLAVLDGRTIDEGVALEIGFAYALNKRCYGFQSDPRRLMPAGNNPMITGVLQKTVATLQELEQLSCEILVSLNRSTHESSEV